MMDDPNDFSELQQQAMQLTADMDTGIHVPESFIKFHDWVCSTYIFSPKFLIFTTIITLHNYAN